MLSKLKLSEKEKSTAGFTIIEIMIVLAIAGLILLIVFLAVPALQRSARNTQRKNDVSAIAAAAANYISNNNGTIPTALGNDADGVSVDLCIVGGCPGANTNKEPAKLGYYTQGKVSFSPGPTPTSPTTDTVVIVPGYSCPTGGGISLSAANTSPRSEAILYELEPASFECQEQ